MKTALNIILLINTVYVLIISENQDPTLFFFPLFIYFFFGFFRYYHKEFSEYLNTPNHEKGTQE
ncbi:hypothetical protein EGI16_10800 [Chryseobacterium sp. G0240]|nr:hypothetical protein EGI16_10800 [Chryseobacterium sp. G0240]